MPLDGLIRTMLRALGTVRLRTVMLSAVGFRTVISALARIGMLGAVMGVGRGAALVTGVPAIHSNVIGGGMGPR